ncbi:ALI_HP2_G0018060.mRNA.1.CDS.1 [Saccharomyces cerevisiae]|nr:ALI_HP2_G0018060.mRNA.1.CDS.1 [Saccharomyces cerevisiae]CAI6498742.1 ALI_HP2_G0018060.mRNA.1.CDS.1 [Saccharomyces cerevisiae]
MKGMDEFSFNTNNTYQSKLLETCWEHVFNSENLYDVHGPGIPMKALEIANALVDVVKSMITI